MAKLSRIFIKNGMIFMKKGLYLIPMIIFVIVFFYSTGLESTLATKVVFGSLGLFVVYLIILEVIGKSRRGAYIGFLLNLFTFTAFITGYLLFVWGLFWL